MKLHSQLLGMAGLMGTFWLASCSDPTPPEIKAAMAKLPEKVDYNLHVKPLLSDRCFACHGPDATKQKAGLRLDTPEGAFGELPENKGRHAIVPGSFSKSELVARILSTDPEYIMPTPESHLTLSEEEKALLIKWVEQGAEYKPHWSLVTPVAATPPAVKDNAWVKSPIDHFVLKKLEEKGIHPAEEADKETLLRRVTVDLTGLPPTPKEIDDFLADTSPDAYEKVVNRLLNSPHYGERMAADWLDLARYADSHGYQDDGMRNSYPYRDWVIRAFNRNLSFDRFVTWQLAGDLLPNPNRDMLIATHFNRNHPQSQEGGIIDEEYRTEYVADRTNTFGKAFLGMTMECARCHDHKYDPISQKDYYSLYAFFNQNKESGEIPYDGEASPTVMLPTREIEEKLKAIREKIQPIAQKLNPGLTEYRKGFETWLATAEKNPEALQTLKNNLLVHLPFEGGSDSTYVNESPSKIGAYAAGDRDRRPKRVTGKMGSARQLMGDCGMDLYMPIETKIKPKERFNKWLNFERSRTFSVSIWINLLKAGMRGPIFNRNHGEFEGYRGYDVSLNKDGTLTTTFSYVWPANCIEIRTLDKVPVNQWTNITLTYDGSAKASGVKLFINGKEPRTRLITDHLTKSMLHGEKGGNWNFMPFQIGKNVRETMTDMQVDELRVYDRRLSALEVTQLAGEQNSIAAILKTPASQRTAAQTHALYEYYLWNFDQTFLANQQEISKLRYEETQVLTDIPEAMVMQELPKDQQRKTFILARGAYDAPTKEEVHAATPHQLLAFDDKKYRRDRLGLAQWLTDENNSLFSRVMVNRYWGLLLGKGLVSTVEDFGNQGALPSHPELLDWLAVNFRKSGWNLKQLNKWIVMSATYRQTSVPTQQALDKDPNNELLSRAPSYRLSAETIRDKVLAASGLLVKKIGGPSVYPYQPAGLWEALATRNATSYTQGKGDDLYRRGLYTIWKRSTPPPSMLTFDAPDRYFCVVRRQKTSTPLQALILMNDPQYVEAARMLGERMMREGGPTPANRVTFAFKAMVGRRPRAKELELMTKLYGEELSDFQKQPQRAKQMLSTGEHVVDKTLNTNELAACTVVATTLINFEETVVKR